MFQIARKEIYSDIRWCYLFFKRNFIDFKNRYFLNSPEKVFLNYNPIIKSSDIPSFNSKPNHPFYKDKNNVLISIGRLSSEKGFLELLTIFTRLIKKFHLKDLRLIIIGEGKYYEEIINFISENSLEKFADVVGFNDDFERFCILVILLSVTLNMRVLTTILCMLLTWVYM